MSKSPLNLTSCMSALALAAAAMLSACGGGDDAGTGAGSGSGGASLTLSAATPATHNTTVDLSTAVNKGNSARAADSFSSVAYCEVFWETANGANGKKYALQVYFRQGDKAALHVSVLDATPAAAFWGAFQNNNGNPITGITVDTTARTLTFASKAITGSSGEAVTLTGTVSFPANSGTPACGA